MVICRKLCGPKVRILFDQGVYLIIAILASLTAQSHSLQALHKNTKLRPRWRAAPGSLTAPLLNPLTHDNPTVRKAHVKRSPNSEMDRPEVDLTARKVQLRATQQWERPTWRIPNSGRSPPEPNSDEPPHGSPTVVRTHLKIQSHPPMCVCMQANLYLIP